MSGTLRVLFVVPEASGGTYPFIRRQIDSLARERVAVETLPLKSRRSARALLEDARRFREAVRSFRPQVVHAQYGTMTGLFAAVLSPVPVVISFRGSDLNPEPGISPARGALGRLFSQASALRAARVICVSEGLRERLWWRREDCRVIPSGVDLEEFRPRPRGEARRLLGWPAERPTALFNCGGRPALKRLDLAQAAVARARRVHPGLALEVLDGGREPGWVPLALCAADCLLVTSEFEGSPNIVKEALACDLPVVSVDVGDVRERLAGVAQCAVTGRSPDELGGALAQVLSRARRCDGRRAVEPLALPATARRIVDVYRSALGERP